MPLRKIEVDIEPGYFRLCVYGGDGVGTAVRHGYNKPKGILMEGVNFSQLGQHGGVALKPEALEALGKLEAAACEAIKALNR